MYKRVGLIALPLVFLIGGGIACLLFTAPPSKPAQNTEAQRSSNTSTDNPPAQGQSASTPGQYVEYKQGVIAQASGTVLLFFHAPWCPQCRAIESDIKAKGVPQGVTIVKVDYDSNQALRQKYGVTIQTTVVRVNTDGELVEKFVAYDDPSLTAVVDALL